MKWATSRDAVPADYVQITVYDEETGQRVATVFEKKEYALLIAAAPKLLAALRLCDETLTRRSETRQKWTAADQRAFEATRAAIQETRL